MSSKIKPFKNFFGFKPQLHNVGGNKWCCLILNDPNSQYGFKEDKFDIEFLSIGGYVEGNQHWLLGTVTDKAIGSEGCYEFDAKKQSDKINEKTGKPIWIADDDVNLQLKTEWKDSGNLVAIKVDDISTLKCLAQALYTKGYITRNTVTAYIRTIVEDKEDKLVDDIIVCLNRLIEVGTPNSTDPYYQTMLSVSQMGILTMPIPSNDKVPSVEVKDIFGNVSDSKPICIPYRGTLPKHGGIDFTLPSVPEKKQYTPSNTTTTIYTPDERLTWVCNALRASNVGIESDTIESIYNAILNSPTKVTYYHMALQLSGVSVEVPELSPILEDVFSTPINVVKDVPKPNNGKLTPRSYEQVQNEVNVQDKYRELLVKSGLVEEYVRSSKRTPKEIEYLMQVLNSNTYQKQLPDLIVWIIKNIGTETDILKLNETQLSKVADAVFHNDNVLAINPDQNIATLVL